MRKNKEDKEKKGSLQVSANCSARTGTTPPVSGMSLSHCTSSFIQQARERNRTPAVLSLSHTDCLCANFGRQRSVRLNFTPDLRASLRLSLDDGALDEGKKAMRRLRDCFFFLAMSAKRVHLFVFVMNYTGRCRSASCMLMCVFPHYIAIRTLIAPGIDFACGCRVYVAAAIMTH